MRERKGEGEGKKGKGRGRGRREGRTGGRKGEKGLDVSLTKYI